MQYASEGGAEVKSGMHGDLTQGRGRRLVCFVYRYHMARMIDVCGASARDRDCETDVAPVGSGTRLERVDDRGCCWSC